MPEGCRPVVRAILCTRGSGARARHSMRHARVYRSFHAPPLDGGGLPPPLLPSSLPPPPPSPHTPGPWSPSSALRLPRPTRSMVPRSLYPPPSAGAATSPQAHGSIKQLASTPAAVAWCPEGGRPTPLGNSFEELLLAQPHARRRSRAHTFSVWWLWRAGSVTLRGSVATDLDEGRPPCGFRALGSFADFAREFRWMERWPGCGVKESCDACNVRNVRNTFDATRV